MGLPLEKTSQAARLYTPEEYLEMERSAFERHEFRSGKIYQMSGESLSHSRICMNLAREFGNKLQKSNCEPLSANMRVRTSSASLFCYPDLTIVCGEPKFHDVRKDVLVNPTVIIEVLSPSTENHDRTTKFARYRLGLETLTDYIMISQDRISVEQYTRSAHNEWICRYYSELGDVLKIPSVGCEVSLSEIYDRVEIEPLEETEIEERDFENR